MHYLRHGLSRRTLLQAGAAAAVATAFSGGRAFAADELAFWSENPEGNAAADVETNFLNAYTAAHPGVTFAPRRVPSEDFNKQFKAAVAAGDPYDVVEINVQFLRDYVINGLLEDLTPQLQPIMDSDFVPLASDQSYTFDMKKALYGVPTQLTTSGIYYNTKVFDAHNLQVPTTWDDVRAIAKKLQGTNISTFVYAGAEPWWNPMWFNAFFFQRTKNNGIATNDAVMKGQASFDSAPYVQAIQDFVDLDRQGIMIKGSQGIDMATADGIFQRGEAAMFFMGTWYDFGLKAAKFTDYGVIPFPILDSSVKSQAPGSVSTFYGVGANSAYKDEAIAVIKAMAGVDFQRALTSVPGAGLPLLKSLQGLNKDPVVQAFEKIAPSTVIWLDALWEPEIIAAVQTGVQTAIVGSATPKEVAASIAQKYTQLRQDGKTYYK
jgi:ABC-type glycerol-3-phosphate transport system substrate-binding protein